MSNVPTASTFGFRTYVTVPAPNLYKVPFLTRYGILIYLHTDICAGVFHLPNGSESVDCAQYQD